MGSQEKDKPELEKERTQLNEEGEQYVSVLHLGKERKIRWRDGMKAIHIIKELSLTPDICMVVRNGEVITEDEKINPGDRIKIIVAISGGTEYKSKKFVDVRTAFGDFLKDYDKEIWAEFKIFENWKSIGGKRKINSLRLKNGVLKITTYDSTLRNFLLFNKASIIQKINEILGENMVEDIFVSGVSTSIFKKFSLNQGNSSKKDASKKEK